MTGVAAGDYEHLAANQREQISIALTRVESGRYQLSMILEEILENAAISVNLLCLATEHK